MKNTLLIILSITLLSCSTEKEQPNDSKSYEPNWSSLRLHNTPVWLDGMKFGIYCHWGPQTIQIASGDKEMSRLDAIEKWTGEKFDAKVWVDLMEDAGAQFGGPVAWHGSGLMNWDSKVTDWNSVNKGPKVDIFGSLAVELRKRDMKVISSYHTSTIWGTTWGPISREDTVYLDPREDNSAYARMNEGRTSDIIFNGWYERISEAIDKYKPDMVWVDVGFGGTVGPELKGHILNGRLLPKGSNILNGVRESYQKKLITHYFNKGKEWGKEVELIYKSFDVPPGIGMRDIEDGNLLGLQYDPWMADINMARHFKWPSPWFYNPENPMKDANTLVDMLIDMTSKNGRMLLNVPPKADGSFAKDQVDILHSMGAWLKLNGEAIYNTIPWVFFGEGPTEVTNPGHHGQGQQRGEHIPKYTAYDIRFTQNGNNLYAICLDWPGKELAIRSLGHLGKLYPGDIKTISLLGSKEPIHWEQTANALVVQFPKNKPCDFAYVLKIERN